MPFIADSIDCHGLHVDEAFRTYARVALVREELRGRIYHDVLRSVRASLCAEHIDYQCLRGAAISQRYYDSPLVRHNHAIDILLAPTDLQRTRSVLLDTFHQTGDSQFEHPSGLPLVLHTRLLDHPFCEDLPCRWPGDGAGTVPPTTTLLLHVLGTAACSQTHGNLRWVVDAWYLLRDTCGIDWPEFVAGAVQCGLAPFYHQVLRYLREQLDSDVPDAVLTSLEEASVCDPEAERRLFSSLLGSHWTHRAVWRALAFDRGLRARFLFFTVYPPGRYLRWRHGLASAGEVSRRRIGRPLRGYQRLNRSAQA